MLAACTNLASASLDVHHASRKPDTLFPQACQPCVDLELEAPARQQILCSRSFAEDIFQFNSMREAITGLVTRGAEKLRQESQKAERITVFIRSCPHRNGDRFYSNRASVDLVEPTSDTRRLAETAHELLCAVWKDGHRYKKGGIMLTDLYQADSWQPYLFQQSKEKPYSDALMRTIDPALFMSTEKYRSTPLGLCAGTHSLDPA